MDLRASATLVVFQPNLVRRIRLKPHFCDVCGNGMIGPVIDDLLVIDPQTDAVVRSRDERVVSGGLGLNSSGPADAVVIDLLSRRRNGIPVKVDLSILALRCFRLEICTFEVMPRQPSRLAVIVEQRRSRYGGPLAAALTS